MTLLAKLPLEELTPTRLWSELDAETRRSAARSLYSGSAEQDAGRREADAAIATRLRFRDVAVRRLPVEKRVAYILGPIRPDDSLAASLLLALHIDQRRALLGAFLDHLEIPHRGGIISDDFDMQPPSEPRLGSAVERLYGEYPANQVDLYLATLVALEPELWGGLADVVRQRDH